MQKYGRLLLGLWVILFLPGGLLSTGQERISDSGTVRRIQEDYLKELIRNSTGAERLFVNGSVYREQFPAAEGHPYYGSREWQPGRVVMNGHEYTELLLRYDIHRDLLVHRYLHETGTYQLALNKELLEEFSMEGSRFTRMGDHFYEVLVEGKASGYQKWEKRYDPPTSTSRGSYTIFSYPFILRNGELFRIKGKRTVIHALRDREREIRRYIREHQLYLRAEDRRDLTRVITYYNSIP